MSNNRWSCDPIPSLRDKASIPQFIRRAGTTATKVFCGYIDSFKERRQRRAVSSILVPFCRWCEGRKMGLRDLSVSAATAYAEKLSEKYSYNTVSVYMTYLRHLCDEFVKKDVLAFNPVHARIYPRPQRNSEARTHLPSQAEVDALIQSIDVSDVAGLRDRAVIAMLFHTLARPREIAALAVKDFYQREGNWWFTFGGRTVPANMSVIRYVSSYMEVMPRPRNSGPLFRLVTPRGSHLTASRMKAGTVARIVKERSLQTEMPDYITAGSIRGAGIKTFLEMGGTVEKAAAITGMTIAAITGYTAVAQPTVVYEGDLDGLLDFLRDSSTRPLQDFVKRSGIFKLTVRQDEPAEET